MSVQRLVSVAFVLTAFASLCSAQEMDKSKQMDKAKDETLKDPSKVFCPICVANGYASGVARPKDWFLTSNSVGTALWNVSIPRLQLGLTYHGSSKAVRALVGYQLATETFKTPGLNISYGIQSQETGATGTSVTLEKNFFRGNQSLNIFSGVSFRSTDSLGRFVGGVKFSPDGTWYVGNQYDGLANNPFVQYTWGDKSIGLLNVAGKKLTATFGITFK
jgi:hypothetical protein